MLGKLVLAMLPGLASSAVKRYSAFNPHNYLLGKVSNADVKYWLGKYFWINDVVLEKTESVFKSGTSTSKKD
jgi:hypothetical protein